MTAKDFRRLALTLPESSEGSHMGHPDFRVRNKIFATIPDPKKHRGMVKLTPDQQRDFVADAPKIFEPIQGAWGLRGATSVNLRSSKEAIVSAALAAAWLNTAPKPLARKFEAAR